MRQIIFLMAVFGLAGQTAVAEVVIETVTIGDPGNAGELSGEGAGGFGPDRICGAVDYVYKIAKYQVTAGQYRDFLNAVDPAGSNPYGIYHISMAYQGDGCQIMWNSGSSIYDFSRFPIGTEADLVDRPVNVLDWGDAARFANWLHNGQSTGQLTGDPAQDAGLTEDGSYFLDGATSDAELMAVVREADATWVIPSEDEWYKAAYYDGGSNVYYDYPMSTDELPNNGNPEGDTGNSANFYDGDYTIDHPYWRSEVGFFGLSESPYGTFDQGGNISEWNEGYGSHRGLRGGAFRSYHSSLHAAVRHLNSPASEYSYTGFRVAYSVCPDQDGDGYASPGGAYCPNGPEEDCNDEDPNVNPGAPEDLCNGIDENCNGLGDDDKNSDGDPVSFCAGDCNDRDAEIFPGSREVCDGKDNDCDGVIDGTSRGRFFSMCIKK